MKHCILWILLFTVFALPVSAESLHCPSPGADDEANREIARRFFRMGSTYIGKDHRKTLEYFNCVLKLVPYSMAARYHAAKALDALKQYSRAREYYELILSDKSVEATQYHQEIRGRLQQIEKLPDEPLPPDDEEANSEEARSYQEKMRLQQERIRKLEEEKALAQKQLKQQLEELEKQGAENMDSRRQQLLEEYKKKEAQKIREMELQLERLRKMEEQMRLMGVNRPRYRDIPRPLRQAGKWVTAGGLLLGAGAIAMGYLTYSTESSLKPDSDKKLWDMKTTSVVMWSTSQAKKDYESLVTLSNWTMALGIAAGIVTAAGVVMYAIGGSDRVEISGSVQSGDHSWRLLPAAGPGTAGFVLNVSW